MYLSSISSRLLLHDTSSWDLKITGGSYEGIIRDVTWSDDSKYMLQVNAAGLVEILCTIDHDVRSLQHIPLKDTWSASFHREGHRNVAVGTKSGIVKIWDTKTKSVTKTLPTPSHASCVQILSYNAKNTCVAATMENGETIIYSPVSNVAVLTVKLRCSSSISAMKFHQASQSLLGLAVDEGHVILRDITTNKDKAFFENSHNSFVTDFAFSLVNKDVMLSCGYDAAINVYDIRVQNIVSTVKTSHILTSMSINTDNLVALGGRNGDVPVYDLRDLSGPLKILKGHSQQVSRVAFQPARQKMVTDISLKEDVETVSVPKIKMPTAGRSSDILFKIDTANDSVNSSIPGTDNKADLSSFLLKMSDKPDNLTDDDLKFNFESEKHELKVMEKNMSQVSTPVNKSEVKKFSPSPSPLYHPNSPQEDSKHLNSSSTNEKPSDDVQTANNIIQANDIPNSKVVEEIKYYVSDIADDTTKYLLHIMMALTKQKLYIEKQFNTLNQRVHHLEQNQDSLIEAYRTLSLQVEQLKTQQNNAYI